MMDMATIEALTRGRFGTIDVACPLCGPDRRSPINRRRPVLRVWRDEPDFATFCCARCGESGFVTTRSGPGERRPPFVDPAVKAEIAAREHKARGERLDLARWLWSRREDAHGTPAEIYLRARGYHGRIPDTLAYLPPSGEHPPAMIAGFGLADEPEPGSVSLPELLLVGVHLTKLRRDGSGKAGTEKDKIMVGHSRGSPIVLAPMNDLLGLAIIEGIEKGLALFQATGLGVWAAGAAARMPALAPTVPSYADCVTVYADDDKDGLRHALALRDGLRQRGLFAETQIRRD
jgi:hypothetical protein